MAVEFYPYSSSALAVDLDGHVMVISTKTRVFRQSRQVVQQRGAVWVRLSPPLFLNPQH